MSHGMLCTTECMYPRNNAVWALSISNAFKQSWKYNSIKGVSRDVPTKYTRVVLDNDITTR